MKQCAPMRSLPSRRPKRLALLLAALGLSATLLGCSRKGSEPEREADRKTERPEEHASIERPISLSTKAIERMGIEVGTVRSGRLERTIDVPAEVRANPDDVVRITPLAAGRVEDVRVELGASVHKGQELATLRSNDLGDARAQLAQADAAVEVAQDNLHRQQTLREQGIASERNLQEARLRLTQAQSARDAAAGRLQVFGTGGGRGASLRLSSPMDGVVVQRDATRGATVGPGDVLFTVANLERVWVVGRVSEQDVGSVTSGTHAIVTLRAYPGRTWSGALTYVARMLDERTRTLDVRIELDNPEGVLRPGLFGTLHIEAGGPATEPVVIVPASAVTAVRGKSIVFVPGQAEHTFRAVPVLLGNHSADEIEVLEGLTAEERVVTGGVFVLKSDLLRDQLGEEGDED